jgi:hypothetical protein
MNHPFAADGFSFYETGYSIAFLIRIKRVKKKDDEEGRT